MSEPEETNPPATTTFRRVLVFTATYNERDNIAELVRRILALPVACDMLVVDDNSPDGTGELLDQLAAAEPRLKAVHRPRKLGLGSAHMLAMAWALREGYEALVTMDADFSHDPAVIPDLLAALENTDFVVGSRYVAGGSCDYVGRRRAMSWWANRLAWLLLGAGLREYTTSFRAFRVSMLREAQFSRIHSQGYSFFMETVWHLQRAGYRCAEIPIRFVDRVHGDSKIPKNEIWNGVLKLGELCLKRVLRWRRPRLRGGAPAGPCYGCGSDLVVELYPRVQGAAPPGPDAYRCTTMAHGSRPQVVRCLACGLTAAGDAPAAGDLTALYEDVVDDTYLRYADARRVTFERSLDVVAPHLPPPGRLLEVGAYTGLFMEAAQERGWTVEGVEPSRWAVDEARRQGLRVIQGGLDDAIGGLAGGYDAIAMWDVLEHLPDPKGALSQLNSLLRKDGVLCLCTLDIDSWFPRLTRHRWPWIVDMHLFYFGRGLLERWLGEAGFEVLAVTPYRHYVSSEYLVEKAAALLPGWLGPLAKAARAAAPRRLYVPMQFGDVKLFVCRKIKDVRRDSALGQEPAGLTSGARRSAT